jgi:hypothetical protein
MRRRAGWCGAVLALCFVASVRAEPKVTTESLLKEMVDRDALARLPDPPFVSHQASSYDRRSVAPDKPEWFANNDWSQFIRSEKHGEQTEWVMMDADGPGAITRIWSGGPKPKGTIRFYLDGSDDPAIDMPAADLIGGTGLVGPPLSQVTARGLNLYLPIPYAKHCKITYDGPNFWETHQEPDQIWYNIEYRTYAAGAAVETFSRAAIETLKSELGQIVQTLTADAPAPTNSVLQAPLGPGAKTGYRVRADDAPGGAIRLLRVRVKANDLASALRSLVFTVHCDGERTIWCPIGDFFGSGLGSNRFATFYRTASDSGELICQWVMPYQRELELSFQNLGGQSVTLDNLAFTNGPWKWDDRSMHFHVNWHQQDPISTKQADGTTDWNYVTIHGKGVYVGDALTVFNPVSDWWGEGDEKIYVDGEKFPSHFGTGTEDFYGYAYGDTKLFSSPFHAQTRCDGPVNKGYTCVTRERLLDAIPFNDSLKVDLEVWHWKATQVGYAATTYWYARPGATSEPGPSPEEAKRPLHPPPRPLKVRGALEGEDLKILRKTGGVTEIQRTDSLNWSGDAQLWWRDAKVDDVLVLEVPVKEGGDYEIVAGLTKAKDYGRVTFGLDGTGLLPIDLYSPDVTTRVVKLGRQKLKAGPHEVSVQIVGANPAAVPRHMVGIDYIQLVPASTPR